MTEREGMKKGPCVRKHANGRKKNLKTEDESIALEIKNKGKD